MLQLDSRVKVEQFEMSSAFRGCLGLEEQLCLKAHATFLGKHEELNAS